ncbi:MAG: glycosyltransferase family 2 protein [Pseudomonadota bacterium]
MTSQPARGDVIALPDRKNRSDFLVVIPARNEERTVGAVVSDIRSRHRCCVVVVDDASTDRTGAVAATAGAAVLKLPFSMGAWCATQAGLRYALQYGYRYVVTMDADGQHHARSVNKILQAVVSGRTDVAVGACPHRLSAAKRVAWAYFRLLTRLSIRDFTSGLRAYNLRAIKVLGRRYASLLDYQDIGVLMLLQRQGITIEEVPVTMSARKAGHSRVFSSWFVVAQYMMQTTVLCVSRLGPRRRHNAEAA